MNNIQVVSDKAAISLSFVCAMHCLAMPLIIVMLPALTVFNLQDEAVHWWMLIAVIPTSLLALTMGCRKHKNYSVMSIGLFGIAILIVTAFFGHDLLGETGENISTVIGALVVAVGHVKNQRLCSRSDCQCNT